MAGATDLKAILRTISPVLNKGGYVFCSVKENIAAELKEIIGFFKEAEGSTFILEKSKADSLRLNYSFIASWITLTVHSSLEAVGLTAAFSRALADEGISCNVIAGYYHDHIFVAEKDAQKAMTVLRKLSENP